MDFQDWLAVASAAGIVVLALLAIGAQLLNRNLMRNHHGALSDHERRILALERALKIGDGSASEALINDPARTAKYSPEREKSLHALIAEEKGQ